MSTALRLPLRTDVEWGTVQQVITLIEGSGQLRVERAVGPGAGQACEKSRESRGERGENQHGHKGKRVNADDARREARALFVFPERVAALDVGGVRWWTDRCVLFPPAEFDIAEQLPDGVWDLRALPRKGDEHPPPSEAWELIFAKSGKGYDELAAELGELMDVHLPGPWVPMECAAGWLAEPDVRGRVYEVWFDAASGEVRLLDRDVMGGLRDVLPAGAALGVSLMAGSTACQLVVEHHGGGPEMGQHRPAGYVQAVKKPLPPLHPALAPAWAGLEAAARDLADVLDNSRVSRPVAEMAAAVRKQLGDEAGEGGDQP